MKQKLREWTGAPIVVPRWFLTMKYLAFFILGLMALLTGISTLYLLTPNWYTTVWAGALVISSFVGAVASFDPKYEGVEKWAALAMAALMLAWGLFSGYRTLLDGDLQRLTGAWVVLITAGLPMVRTLGLMRTAGL